MLLGKSQKNDRVHPALGSHPCPGFAECYRERARMLQGVIPVAAPGRINRGHLELHGIWENLFLGRVVVNPRIVFLKLGDATVWGLLVAISRG